MRPPRALAAAAALALAAALSARAQIETDVGPSASETNGASAAGASAAGAIAAPAALVAPSLGTALTAAPSLTLAPAARPANAALPASALAPAAAPAPAAAAAEPSASPAPTAAAASAAAPPAGPRTGTAAPPSAPPGPPDFLDALRRLGVPDQLTSRLDVFLSTRHPGDQSAIYHGLGHTREVAGYTARLVEGQDIPASRKILLVLAASLHDVDPDRTPDTPARVSATLAHLDADPEARALLAAFGSRYGFTADQVKALIMATDFSVVPAEMQAKQAAFAAAADAAFPGDDFGRVWGDRLAFVDQASTYLGDVAHARERVAGLANEIRAQLAASGHKGGPTDEQMLAGSYRFLSVLRRNPDFALMPPDLQANFDAVLSYFEARQTPEAWADEAAPPPARAPPDLAAARRYIRGIAAGISLDERQTDALLGDFFADNGIDPRSERAQAVRRELTPGRTTAEEAALASVPPALRRHRAALLRLAAEHGTTPAGVLAVLERRGVLSQLAPLSERNFERQAEKTLDRDVLERAVSGYPKGPAGELMRQVADAMATPSGKSVEEVARDGVFVYADFPAAGAVRAWAGRDPDVRSSQVVFYVTRQDERWRVGVYRQNRAPGRADSAYVAALKRWLIAGGVPARDLD